MKQVDAAFAQQTRERPTKPWKRANRFVRPEVGRVNHRELSAAALADEARIVEMKDFHLVSASRQVQGKLHHQRLRTAEEVRVDEVRDFQRSNVRASRDGR